MIIPFTNTWKLNRFIQKIKRRCGQSEFIYEYDFDAMPGTHGIKLVEGYLPEGFSYNFEFGPKYFEKLIKLGKLSQSNYFKDEKVGIERITYRIN